MKEKPAAPISDSSGGEGEGEEGCHGYSEEEEEECWFTARLQKIS